MSEFKPTASQRLAIGSRGSAVLVSAGAGSGKTKVLTERLMAWLRGEDGADLDEFLIITFTRAAAGELRGRIMEELSAALAEDPGNRRLRKQSALVRRAQIGTIHSFCANLLREYSHQAELSPDFKILDEDRAAMMKAAAMERVLERSYLRLEQQPDFRLLADTVGAGRDDAKLGELALSLYNQMQCHARPEVWAQAQIDQLRTPVEDVAQTDWGRQMLLQVRDTAAYWAEAMDRAIGEMRAEPKIFAAYYDSFAETADGLRTFVRQAERGWDAARTALPIRFPRMTLRNSPDPALSDRVKEIREACKKAMEKIGKTMDRDSATLLRETTQTSPAMCALLQMVMEFDREYARAKRRANLVDYGDLEHKAAKLLTREDGSPSELAGEISGRFREIMVDEYQDVSQVQDAIFAALSRSGKNLFMVGDVKQSIYRFRLADPEIFNQKYREYGDAESTPEGEPRRILLRENFRSRQEIIDGANAIFRQAMSRSLGDVDYDDAAALIFGSRAYTGRVPKPELLLLDESSGDDDEDSPDRIAGEAALVAREIRELMASGCTVTGKEGVRPLQYGDIAILLRTANRTGPAFRRELGRLGLPVAAGQGGGFFSAVEVSAVLSMLSVIDDPHQDVALIAALRSPAFGFTADELVAIRACDKDADLYTALRLYGEKDPKAAAFLELLESLRRRAPDLSAADLVSLLLEEMDLLAICCAMSEAEQRRNRLTALIGLAESYEASGFKGLHRFVLWLRQRAQKGEEPALGAGGDSAVQILSVHKSKGLEFPVVFLCDTAHQFKKTKILDGVLVHPQLGLGPMMVDLERRVKYPTLAYHAIMDRQNRELVSEEMRLLYVALTRAKERLFVTARVKNAERALGKLANQVSSPLSPEILRGKVSPAEWMILAVLADEQEHWSLRVCQRPREEASAAPEEIREWADEDSQSLLEQRLRFVYPHRGAETLPSKVTATQQKGDQERDEDAYVPARIRKQRQFRLPDFTRADQPVTGTEKGTATHLVLQVMDFSRTGSPEEIRQEIESLRERGFLSRREAEAVDEGAIFRLFRSPLGQRILAAKTLKREFKFSLLCPASEYFPDGEGEQVLLQGVVDCYLEDENGLTVIDYKTDRVHSKAEAVKRAEHYRGQLNAYARALERILRKPVREKLLVFLSVGETVALD